MVYFRCEFRRPSKEVENWNRGRRGMNKRHVNKPATTIGNRTSITQWILKKSCGTCLRIFSRGYWENYNYFAFHISFLTRWGWLHSRHTCVASVCGGLSYYSVQKALWQRNGDSQELEMGSWVSARNNLSQQQVNFEADQEDIYGICHTGNQDICFHLANISSPPL